MLLTIYDQREYDQLWTTSKMAGRRGFFIYTLPILPPLKKKSRIREAKHLSTDADSSTDTIVGWTKNTQKPNFFEKRKKSSKTQTLKKV